MNHHKLSRHIRNERMPETATVRINMGVLVTNILLLVAALALLAYYVVQANTLAAMQYDIVASGDDIADLREQHHSIGAKVADLEHSDAIAAYALSAGMVVASDASYVSIPDSPLAGR